QNGESREMRCCCPHGAPPSGSYGSRRRSDVWMPPNSPEMSLRLLLRFRREVNFDRVVALCGPADAGLLELFRLADVAVAVPDYGEAVVGDEGVGGFLGLEDVHVSAVAEAGLGGALREFDDFLEAGPGEHGGDRDGGVAGLGLIAVAGA